MFPPLLSFGGILKLSFNSSSNDKIFCDESCLKSENENYRHVWSSLWSHGLYMVHRFSGRLMEWSGLFPFSRGSSQFRDRPIDLRVPWAECYQLVSHEGGHAFIGSFIIIDSLSLLIYRSIQIFLFLQDLILVYLKYMLYFQKFIHFFRWFWHIIYSQ